MLQSSSATSHRFRSDFFCWAFSLLRQTLGFASDDQVDRIVRHSLRCSGLIFLYLLCP